MVARYRECSILLALLFALACAGCGEPTVEEDLTGVDLTITHEEGLGIDQVSITMSSEGEMVLEPERLPAPPRALDPAGESASIILSDEYGGKSVDFRVSGLTSGEVTCSGEVSVTLELRRIVEAQVHLVAQVVACGNGEVEGDEACDDGDVDPGDGCSELCLVEEGYLCPIPESGPSLCELACGNGEIDDEEECDDGDADPGDGCDEECVVEEGHVCTRPETGPSVCNPTCENGACDPGLRCVEGLCVCDDQSCPAGCCDGASCELRSFETCGNGGSTCVVCDEMASDICSAEGLCRCGSYEPCSEGLRCHNGNCICDEISCPSGCCDENGCQEPASDSCGVGGDECTTCNPTYSDGCSIEGTCSCGDGPACVLGTRCVDGECRCDAVSCSTGCCYEGRCEELSLTTCGAPGTACSACDALLANVCAPNGSCRCGDDGECALGERCDGGTCICDPATCPGCCQGGQCLDGTAPEACGSGGADCIECPLGETCNNGSCSSCDAQSCPDGCCSGVTCNERSLETCGDNGGPCQTCDLDATDTCSELGECLCGSSPPCDEGQRCDAGLCLCDDVSCPTGCCDGDICHEGISDVACGTGGAICSLCGELEECIDHQCTGCGPNTCDGCCSGAVCMELGFDTCATGGVACVACDPATTDTCTVDGCRCGARAPCASPRVCVSGRCDL